MNENQTVIIVGVTETDEYGHLWVTPQGGGDRVKIAKKREQLHPLFQQGKAVMLKWQTYMDKPYVADAQLVEGNLPPPKAPEPLPAEAQAEVDKAVEASGAIPFPPKPEPPAPAPQAIGMITKEIGDMIRAKYLVSIFGPETQKELIRWYRGQVLGITRIPCDGAKLPTFEKAD